MSPQHIPNQRPMVGSVNRKESPRIGSHRYRAVASLLIVLPAIIGLLLVNVTSKPALSQGVQLVKVDVSVVGKGYRAGKLIGASVTNEKNEKIGTIDDIIIDSNRIMYAVLQVGGFLGFGKHLVALPYDSLKIDPAGKKIELPGATKEELKKLAEFKYLT